MKILVVGGGGREHALVWKISRSPLVEKVYCAPGNPGTAQLAENVPLKVDDLPGLLGFAVREGIDLTVVGPELPLSLGIVDLFEEHGLKVFGARRNAALIEASKAFSKGIMKKYGIPTAAYEVFTEVEPAISFLDTLGIPVVIKADGLAAGKGVIVAQSREEAVAAVREMLSGNSFGEAGSRVVVEEFLKGEEVSLLAFTDGTRIIPMPGAQDHKQVFDGDRGPNTGGMGAYSPAPLLTEALRDKALAEVLQRAVDGLAAEGRPYRGVLYAGLMIDGESVKTLEFNARFGDPECQPLLMRMKSDIVPVLQAVAAGDISGVSVEWDERAAICVVMAAENYPADYPKGDVIRGIEAASALEDVVVFHAGTAESDGNIVTAGGRVLGVTAVGESVSAAIRQAYAAVGKISWRGEHHRSDIGKKALKGSA